MISKYINLPMVVLGLFFVVFVNVWAADRDTKLFHQYCEANPTKCDIGW